MVEQAVKVKVEDGSRSVDAPKAFKLQDMVRLLPSRLSYSTIGIPLVDGGAACIPRRDLFDIRMQLMAEDPKPESEQTGQGLVASMLGNNDIQKQMYEGGLKSWECSLDLVACLENDIDTFFPVMGKDDVRKQVYEIGCGTALPSLCLFQHALKDCYKAVSFTLLDYNFDVLRLVTLPNLFLNWIMVKSDPSEWLAEDELEVTEDLKCSFLFDLANNHITLSFVCGRWSDELFELLPPPEPQNRPLILASETIYSPENIRPFIAVLRRLLQSSAKEHATNARALIAAKKVYFGVGGGVAEFVRAFGAVGGFTRQVMETGTEGVARVVLEAVLL
ncbi:MAG: hypothetical protein M1826_003563 [Phylliscum demangeonii]|nr:MAG: hypothetical protein M1826_003563 [Phylliscum demangeonii]